MPAMSPSGFQAAMARGMTKIFRSVYGVERGCHIWDPLNAEIWDHTLTGAGEDGPDSDRPDAVLPDVSYMDDVFKFHIRGIWGW